MEKIPYSRRARASHGSHLRVVADRRAPSVLAPLRAVPLEARPCRPGELPHRVSLTCERDLARTVARSAACAGVPSELWIRIVVEAARVRDDIATISRDSRSSVQQHLDAAAGRPLRDVPGCGELRLYARLLRDHTPSPAPRTPAAASLRVTVPDTIRCAWLAAAADAQLTLGAWLADRLQDPPAAALDWEAAAAASGRELGEWGYSSWMARPGANADAHTLL
jgi:hypothetical protein